MTRSEAVEEMCRRVARAGLMCDAFALMIDRGDCPWNRTSQEENRAKWSRKLTVRTAALARLKAGLA